MKKFLLIAAAAVVTSSCVSQRDIMNSWMGKTKHDIILKWGPPVRTDSDGAGGEILIYASSYYIYNVGSGWTYRMVYAKPDGTLYHWFIKTSPTPPTQIDVRFLN